ncbi:MAG: dihydrodipicolinate synthase family protein [Treponema sp.]|nr:dihydrodipicolinate synthase family protein [Treponema sp.]
MSGDTNLGGVYAPITTPFDSQGGLDLDSLNANIERYAQTGLAGFLVLGSNGEHRSLNFREKQRVLDCVIARKAPRQTVMAGSIFESTRETIEFALLAEDAGADFIALLPPSYFKSAMNDAALAAYFGGVASAVKKPCLLYRAPQFCGGLDISVNLIQELARHPNIAGVKDSAPAGIEKIIFSAPEHFTVLAGSANTFFSAMINGAAGGVLSLADYLPEYAVRLFQLLRQGDLERAAPLNRRILACNMGVSGAAGVAGVKAAMDHLGYRGGLPRLPLAGADLSVRESIGRMLDGLIRDFPL